MPLRFSTTVFLLALTALAEFASAQSHQLGGGAASVDFAEQVHVGGDYAAGRPFDDGSHVCDNVLGEICDDPLWLSVAADFVWLGRSRVVDGLLFDVKGGVRGEVALGPPHGRGLQLGYMGVVDQSAETVFDFGGNTFQLTYESHLHNADLNYRFRPYGKITPLAGFRWIQQAETQETVDVATPTSSSFDELRNDLIGAQLGFELPLWQRGGWFRGELLCKFGVYHNEMNLRLRDQLGGPPLWGGANFNTVSYAGEIQLSAVWQVHQHFLFRAGYVGLWLTDVGAVAENLDVVLGAAPLLLNSVNYHGGQLGIELRW